jgi:glucose/arabinose dehydrogenase
MRTRNALAVCSLWLLAACGGPAEEPAAPPATTVPPVQGPVELSLPEGFTATVFAEGVGKDARHLAVNANGDVYVNVDGGDEARIVALRDTDGDGRADLQESFGSIGGTGIAIRGGHLYASTRVSVHRYALDPERLAPAGEPELIVSGLPEKTEHHAKSITFDGEGRLYVNVGAPTNACMEQKRTPGSPGQDPCPQREWEAAVWRFDADRTDQTQREDGQLYSSGSRNLVALEWNDAVGSLYAVQHGRDDIARLWPERYQPEDNAELPAEEMFRIGEGDDLGWPFCYYDPVQKKKLLNPEYGGDGQTEDRCAGMKQPILAFPAHMAPNDLLFYTGDQFPESYRGGAFVAFHGSWNRSPQPQMGYLVAFVPMTDGSPSGEWSVFADGFSGLEQVPEPAAAAHRPCGLAVGPDGSLYVSDSVEGTIWRIRYTG